MIFHEIPAGDRPLVRMPLQKVLVRFHHGSSDTLSDRFILDAVLHCIFFLRYLFLFSWGGGFSFAIGAWRLCDWMILTCDVWCCVGLGWLGVALGLLVYWLKCLTMALLSQFKFPSPFTRAYLHSPGGFGDLQHRTLPGRWRAPLHVFPSTL